MGSATLTFLSVCAVGGGHCELHVAAYFDRFGLPQGASLTRLLLASSRLLKIQRRQPALGLDDVVEVGGGVGLADERKGPCAITASRLGAGEEPKEAQGPRRVGGGEGVVHVIHHDWDPQAVIVY